MQRMMGRSALRAHMLKTGQTTTYHVGDDGNQQKGIATKYTVYTTGGYSGTSTVDVAHYAAATISFDSATKKILDSASGVITVLTGDKIRVRGSGSNDGVYTVATGGVAGEIVTTEALINEAAGAYVTIYKETTISNNVVLDSNSGLFILRNTSTSLKIGEASTGTLNWYNVATCFTLHPAAADLQIIAAPSNILRIVAGAGEVNRYHVGDLLDLTGFATAVNNLPGYRVLSVTVNGADLDVVLDPVKSVLVAEAAAGARSILLICRSCFTYCAAANAAAVGGYTDWRIPSLFELISLADYETPNSVPNAVAFPSFPITNIWTSTIRTTVTTLNMSIAFAYGSVNSDARTNFSLGLLVRGGTP